MFYKSHCLGPKSQDFLGQFFETSRFGGFRCFEGLSGNHGGEAWRVKTKLFRSPGTIWPPCDKGEFSCNLQCSLLVKITPIVF